MNISGIKLNAKPIESITSGEKIQKTDDKKGHGPQSFGDMFTTALKDVNQLQMNADHQIEGLMLGKDGVTTHDAMIALEKADVAFQMMNQIRSKIVRAYQEVIRTQI